MKKQDLWKAIEAYNFDNLVPTNLWQEIRRAFGGVNPSLKAFANKMAEKQGWTREFSLKAIQEYKRFVYLGIVSETAVTPSKTIDEVWHQHILFTKGYDEFSKDVLKQRFDHAPEIMKNTAQSAGYDIDYARTLSLYKTEFGKDAPKDIWGSLTPTVSSAAKYMPKESLKGKVSDTYDDTPLYLLMASCGSSVDVSSSSNNSNNDSGFSGYGGGHFGGGGASASFASSDTSSHSSHSCSSHSSHSCSSGSSCSSASSCSSGSSCGGGGCGGGGCGGS